MTDFSATLPPIERWWPYLTIGSRHAVLRDPSRPLENRVLVEIERATGETIGPGATLTDADRDFIETQMEAVD